MRHWFRAVIQAAGFLVLGCAVGWIFNCAVNVAAYRWGSISAGERDAFGSVPEKWFGGSSQFYAILPTGTPGRNLSTLPPEVRQLVPEDVLVPSWQGVVIMARSGLPFRSSRGVVTTPIDGSQPETLRGLVAIGPSRYSRGRSNVFKTLMPIEPTAGLLYNGLCFGSLFWVAQWGFGAAKRHIRSRRGHCWNCGYPIVAGATTCPECGKVCAEHHAAPSVHSAPT